MKVETIVWGQWKPLSTATIVKRGCGCLGVLIPHDSPPLTSDEVIPGIIVMVVSIL